MKVKLENREYELVANGKFMKKYQETFNENMIMALYKCSQEKDIYTASKLTYCAINEDKSFDEWLDSFETPLFLINEMDNIITFLIRSIEPTVEAKEDPTEKKEEDPKKKNQ